MPLSVISRPPARLTLARAARRADSPVVGHFIEPLDDLWRRLDVDLLIAARLIAATGARAGAAGRLPAGKPLASATRRSAPYSPWAGSSASAQTPARFSISANGFARFVLIRLPPLPCVSPRRMRALARSRARIPRRSLELCRDSRLHSNRDPQRLAKRKHRAKRLAIVELGFDTGTPASMSPF